jgi:hypothetical protein
MLAIILQVIFCLVGVTRLESLGAYRGFEAAPFPLHYAFLALAVLVAVLVHESGHRIAGKLMGWNCTAFGFGPFAFYRDRKVWKRQRVKVLWGAFVRQMPPGFARYRQQKALTLMSGPLASLIVGGLFLAIVLDTQSAAIFAVFSRLALVSLLGFSELIPAFRKGIGTDGYRLRQVIRGGEELDELYRESMAEASNYCFVRYRDWPREVLQRIASGDDPYNVYLAYLHMLDSGDIEAAAGYMRRLIASLPEAQPRPFQAYEAAYWLATYGGDVAAAKQWLDRAAVDESNVVRVQAEAAIAAAEGQWERASTLVQRGLVLAHDPGECGGDQVDVERLRRILSTAPVGEAAVTGA